MTDITELAQSHELLIANGNETANLLRHLANNEIDSDYFAVVSECESYGQETDAELSITEFSLRAAGFVDALVEALEKAQTKNELVAGGIAVAEKQHERIAYLEKRLKGTEESLIAATDMVRELESLTVKMPEPFKLAKSSSGLTYYFADDVDTALAAAGIKVEAE
ncbi:hypothetical protein [Klebsiella pneumoniae]|uniref:hypothetical protein n=1 Tax=Klebsiella pneumoniae TaxID=573 RepID=UPI0007CD2F59|nr:hypothetical protein [Klebsiella pneumoniae]SBJ80672.1 Uncharacterised protein [Klebsiella pneumoniae]